MTPDPTGKAFIEESRRLLRQDFGPRVRSCLERLDDDELWWRPNESSNAVGNLVVHMCGNLRQWVVSGLAGEPDVRRRQEEFDRDGGLGAAELTRHLDATLDEVDRALASLDPAVLGRDLTVQGTGVTGLQALYHTVEHFSMHTGQILWITKMRLGEDLGFYRVEDGVATPRWDRGR